MSNFDLSKITGNEPPLEFECKNCQALEASLSAALAENERLKADLAECKAAIKAFCEAIKRGDSYFKKQVLIAVLFEILEKTDE